MDGTAKTASASASAQQPATKSLDQTPESSGKSLSNAAYYLQRRADELRRRNSPYAVDLDAHEGAVRQAIATIEQQRQTIEELKRTLQYANAAMTDYSARLERLTDSS